MKDKRKVPVGHSALIYNKGLITLHFSPAVAALWTDAHV